MIRTKLISVPKKNNGSTTIIKTVSSGGAAPSINPVYLWGNYFDGTSNVNGSMTINGNIFTEGDIRTNTLYVKTLNLEGEMTFDNLTVDTLTAETSILGAVTATTGNITTLNADTGILGAVTATTGNITTLNADTGILGAVTATTGNITNLTSDSVTSDEFILPTWTIDEDTNHNLCVSTNNSNLYLKIIPNDANINLRNVGFYTNLSAYNFVSGASGWKIFSNGNAEFQNIKVNGSFDAYTITYNNIRATNGIMLVTDTGFITAVEEKTISDTKYYIFTISEYPPFAVDDYVLLQYKVSATTIKKFKGIVRAINLQEDGTNTVRVAPYTNEDIVDVDTAVGQYLTRVGNYTNTNRQTVIKLNPYDGGYIDFLKNLNDGSITADEDSIVNLLPTVCRIGNLSGVTYNSQSLSGYGLYADNVYLVGAIGNVNNKWRLNNDGSGQLANNHIQWDASGNLTITLNSGTELTQYIDNKVDESMDDSLTYIEGEIDDIKNDYVTKTDFNVTTSGITSRVSDNEDNISTLQQTVNGLTSTVSSHTTSISTLDGEVATNTSNISTLQQTANSLTSTVSGHTTSINTLNGEVTTNTNNISQLQQTADGLTSTVSSHTTSINTLNGEVTTNTNNISTLQQTSTQISSKVSTIEGDYVNQSTLQQTANSINARVDNIKVGGTNLIMGTQNYNTSGTNLSLSSVATVGPDKRNDCTVLHCPLDTSVGYSDVAHWSNISIDPDTYYTLSFYAYANSNIDIASYFYHTGGGCVAEGYNSQDRTTTQQDGEIITTLSTAPTRYWVVWKTKTSVGEYESLIPARFSTNSGIHIWGIKLEKGNMATDWSPSPDEYATHAEISVEADNIKLAVYDELNQSTGINVSNGTITLDADNTTIVGNLNLTDTNYGLTVYDPDEVGRVYLQPDSINSRCTSVCDGGSMIYQTMSKTVTRQSNCTVTLDKLTMNNPGADKVFNLSNFNVLQYTGQSTIRAPYSLTIKIYKDNTVVKTETVSLKNNGTGFYITNPEDYCFTYTFLDNSTYYLEITVNNYTSISTSLSLFTSVNAKHQYGGKVETYIGQNGLYCHSAANKHLIVNEKKIELRNELSGFRLSSSDPYNETNNFGRLEVIATHRGNLPNITPVWLPFWNYTPLRPVGTNPRPWTNGTIITGQNKYYYQIKPAFDSGIFFITDPPYDSSFNKVNEAWVVLPQIDNYDKDGNSFTLPEGYTVTIVNNTFGSHACDVYVSPGESGTKIIDAHRDENTYSNLSNNQTNDTFIYCGEFNNTPYWRQLHDTQ